MNHSVGLLSDSLSPPPPTIGSLRASNVSSLGLLITETQTYGLKNNSAWKIIRAQLIFVYE